MIYTLSGPLGAGRLIFRQYAFENNGDSVDWLTIILSQFSGPDIFPVSEYRFRMMLGTAIVYNPRISGITFSAC